MRLREVIDRLNGPDTRVEGLLESQRWNIPAQDLFRPPGRLNSQSALKTARATLAEWKKTQLATRSDNDYWSIQRRVDYWLIICELIEYSIYRHGHLKWQPLPVDPTHNAYRDWVQTL